MVIPSNDNRVNAKRAADAMTRLSRIEASLFGTQKEQGLTQRIDQMDQLLAAIVETVGMEAIQQAIGAQQAHQQEERAKAQKAAIEAALAEGSLVVDPTITVESLLVVNQFGADGQLKTTQPVTLPAKQMEQTLLTQLLGQSAGFEMELQNKDKLRVEAVYCNAPTAVKS
jgi:hypothetical protein